MNQRRVSTIRAYVEHVTASIATEHDAAIRVYERFLMERGLVADFEAFRMKEWRASIKPVAKTPATNS